MLIKFFMLLLLIETIIMYTKQYIQESEFPNLILHLTFAGVLIKFIQIVTLITFS